MAEFAFEAKSLEGKVVRGIVTADTEVEARVKLRSRQLMPLKLSLEKSKEKNKEFKLQFINEKVSSKELQVFTRQFAVLVGAGVPIVDSLEAMIGGGKSPLLNKSLRAITDDIESGRPLNEAMKAQDKVFDRLYVNLVKAGEEGGVLDSVLLRLSEYIEKSVKLKNKIKGAMWYPAIIIAIALIVIAGMLIFVVPLFEGMYTDNSKDLPGLTKMVVSLNNLIVDYWYLFLGLIVSTPIALASYYRTGEGRNTVDKLLLDVPLIGDLVQKSAIARFSRTLATLLAAGVRIIDSLEIAAATSGNNTIEKSLLQAKESISSGRTLTEPLKRSDYIPSMVSQMISVGEQTGNLDTMLGKVADFYEDEVETTAEAMTSLIEPILMVVLGGIIAVLVLAMYLPVFDVANTVGG